jgi:hypothetical protein
MKPENYPKLISWIIVSFLLGALVQYDYTRQAANGYAAFIAKQELRWTNTILHPNFIGMLVGALFVGGLFILIYELISALFRKMMRAN